jgi:hypothetical protein
LQKRWRCRFADLIWSGLGWGLGQKCKLSMTVKFLSQTYAATTVTRQDGVLQRLVPLKCPFDVNRAD